MFIAVYVKSIALPLKVGLQFFYYCIYDTALYCRCFTTLLSEHYSIYSQVIGEILKKLSPTMDTQGILETFLFSFSTLTIAFLFRYLLCLTQFLF